MNRVTNAFCVLCLLTCAVFAQSEDIKVDEIKQKVTAEDRRDSNRIYSLSPDKSMILLINKKSVQLRSMPDGRLLQTFPSKKFKNNKTLNAAWQPSGAKVIIYNNNIGFLIFGYSSKNAYIWDTQTGATTILASDEIISEATWSQDGNSIRTYSGDYGLLLNKTPEPKYWDANGRTSSGLEDLRDFPSAFPNGFADLLKTQVKLQNETVAKLKTVIFLENLLDKIEIAALSPDGKKVLVVSGDAAQIRSAETGLVLQTLPATIALPGEINGAEWQPDSRQIALWNDGKIFGGASDQQALLWNAETGALTATLKGAEKPIQSAQWNKNGDRLLTRNAFYDEISLWDASGKLLARRAANGLKTLDFAENDRDVIVTHSEDERKAIEFWNGSSLATVKSFESPTPPEQKQPPARFAAESPDGKLICGTIEKSKGVACWNKDGDGQAAYTFFDGKETGTYYFTGFSGDGKSFAIVNTMTDAVSILDTATGKPKSLLSDNSLVGRSISSIPSTSFGRRTSWTPNGEFIVVNTFPDAQIYNAATGAFIGTLPSGYSSSSTTTETRTVYRSTPSKSSSKSSSSSSSGGRRSAGSTIGKSISQSKGSSKKNNDYTVDYESYDTTSTTVIYYRLRINPVFNMILTASDSGVSIYDLPTGELLQTISVNSSNSSVSPRTIADFSADGTRLLTLKDAQTLIVYEVKP